MHIYIRAHRVVTRVSRVSPACAHIFHIHTHTNSSPKVLHYTWSLDTGDVCILVYIYVTVRTECGHACGGQKFKTPFLYGFIYVVYGLILSLQIYNVSFTVSSMQTALSAETARAAGQF